MKYYLIAGEASGDLHASHLMNSLKGIDPEARFRFFGGDLMQQVGGMCVKHYRELAYMGFVPVLRHLPTILRNLETCKRDIAEWHPDAVILVDYPGFNLRIAKFVHKHTAIPVYYYISPKIWAWNEWRVRAIRRDVSAMFSILPFEVPFYEKRHKYKIHYVGNPTVEEISKFRQHYTETRDDFCRRHELGSKPIIALLPGSREQEITANLPTLIESSSFFTDYQAVVAAAPSVEKYFYLPFLRRTDANIVCGETYELLSHSVAALVVSGTATLETALFNVPQVVCYATSVPSLTSFAFRKLVRVDYISLINLIAGREVVREIFAGRFGAYNIAESLHRILLGHPHRESVLEGYAFVRRVLGNGIASDNAARFIVEELKK